MLWIFIVQVFFLCKRKGKKILAVVSPIILMWGTLMIATPVATQSRYVFAFVFMIPILIGMLFLQKIEMDGNS